MYASTSETRGIAIICLRLWSRFFVIFTLSDTVVESAGNEIRSMVSLPFWKRLPSKEGEEFEVNNYITILRKKAITIVTRR